MRPGVGQTTIQANPLSVTILQAANWHTKSVVDCLKISRSTSKVEKTLINNSPTKVNAQKNVENVRVTSTGQPTEIRPQNSNSSLKNLDSLNSDSLEVNVSINEASACAQNKNNCLYITDVDVHEAGGCSSLNSPKHQVSQTSLSSDHSILRFRDSLQLANKTGQQSCSLPTPCRNTESETSNSDSSFSNGTVKSK